MSLKQQYLIAFLLLSLGMSIVLFFYLRAHTPQNLLFEQPSQSETIPTTEPSAFPEVSPQTDCSNECTNYKNDKEKYTYCRTVCGFTSEEGLTTPPATSSDPSLSSDYVLRDKAIRERDIKQCLLIQDRTIRNMCQARVAEDLLEE